MIKSLTEIHQAALFDVNEKIAETHELLVREKEFQRHHEELMERRLENAIRIGQNLLDFKTTLPHGKFMTFVQVEFGISQSTACDYMNLADQNGNLGRVLNLPLRSAFELASPSTPPVVIEMVETKQIPPTVAAIREAKREVLQPRNEHVMQVMGSSESPEWYTPQEIVQLSIQLLGSIDLDPCSNSREAPNIPAKNHYTKEDDGLSKPWQGKVYLNPPYGTEIGKWIDKLVGSYVDEQVEEAIALLPARIDTNWFQPLYDFPMCNIRGRLQFENAIHNAPFPSVIAYLGFRETDFIQVFKDCGPIMRRIG